MNIQRRVGQTAASRLGISIFDCTGKTIKQLKGLVEAEALRRAAESEQATEKVQAADRARENRTMALDDSELEVLSEGGKSEGSGDAPTDPKAGPPAEARPEDEMGDVDGLLRDIGRLTGRPPRPERKLTAQRGDDSVLFTIKKDGEPAAEGADSSVMLSLADLQRVGAERAAEPKPEPKPAAAPAKKRPESSVEMSLQELQGIEQERLEAERIEAERAAEQMRLAQEKEAARLAEERRRAEAEANAREEAQLREDDERLSREVDELLESFPPDETADRVSACQLSEVQLLLYSDILPEGRRMWMIPVSLSNHPEQDTELMALIGGSPAITLAERTYYICTESHGIAKAVEAVRRGRELALARHAPEPSAEIPVEVDETELGLPWKQDFIAHTLEGDELRDAAIVLPERAVRWLLPVPDAGSSEGAAKALFRRFKDEPRLTIGGRSYFVFAGKEGFAGAKWCARTGSLLQVWSEPGTDYSLEDSADGSSGSIRVLDTSKGAEGAGIPWDEGHVRYMLQSEEYVASFAALPERAVRWLIPAPEPDMKDRVSESIRRKFADEPKLELNGKTYYVYSGEDGFAGARWCARTGNVLNVWPQAMTDYEYAGSLGGRSAEGALETVKETGWPERFFYHRMSAEEMEAHAGLFPEGEPVLMHPVPPADTAISGERTMLEELPALGARKAVLGGNEYFVVPLDSMSAWRHITIYCPKTRVAARTEDRLGIWEEAGAILFNGTTFNVYPAENRGPPLVRDGGHVVPFENEELDVEYLYQGGKKSRYLFAVPERVGEIGAETFNNLVQIAASEARKTGQSPLISLQGRWYFALEYAYVGSRLTSLEEDRIRVYPVNEAGISQRDLLAEMKARIIQKRVGNDAEFVTLSTDPGMRSKLLTSFPPGKVRYLYNIDPDDPNYAPEASDLIVRDGDVQSVWRMSDQPIPGMTIPVMRKGDVVFLVEEARRESIAPRPVQPARPEPTMELSAGDLMIEPPMVLKPNPAPPVPARKGTIQGFPAIHELAQEPSEPPMEVSSGQIVIDSGEMQAGAAGAKKPESSVEMSLQELQQIERERIAREGPGASTPAMELGSGEIELIEDGNAGTSPPKSKNGAAQEKSEPTMEIRTGEFEIEEDDS